MKLYEIAEDLQRFLEIGFDEECIDPETGEILEEKLKERLDSLKIDFETKIENTALVTRQLELEANSIKEEEKRLSGRRKAKEKRVASLEKYISFALLAVGKEIIETPRAKIFFTKSKSVEITDLEKLSPEFLRTKTTTEPDKTAIKNAINEGKEVAGAELKENKNLKIK